MPNKALQIKRIREKRAMANLAKIRKGDKVRLFDCLEAEAECNAGRLFLVLDEPKEICGKYCFRLEGKGWFDAGCVELAEKGDPQ